MTIEPIVLWSAIGISLFWVVLFFWKGFRARKGVKTIEHFLIYGKDMTRKELRWTLYATNISLASIFLAISVSTVQVGLGAVWLIVAWLAGMWFFLRFYKSPEIQNFLCKEKGRTMYQFMGNAYQSIHVRKIGAVLGIIVYIGSVGAEFYAIIKVFEFLGLPTSFALPVSMTLTMLTVVYAAMGGFRSVVKTEFLQLCATIIGCVVIYFLLILGVIKAQAPISRLLASDVWMGNYSVSQQIGFAVVSFILFIPFMISSMDAWQRAAAISQEKDPIDSMSSAIKYGYWVFSIVYLIPIFCGLVFLEMGVPDVGQQAAPLIHPITQLLTNFPIYGQIIIFGCALSAFVAAMISTADTLLVSSVYALFYDILGVTSDGVDMAKKDFSEESLYPINCALIQKARGCMLLFGLFSIIITVLGVLDVAFMTIIWTLFSSLIVFAVPLCIAVKFPDFAKGKASSATTSMIAGFTAVITLIGWGYIDGSLEKVSPIAPLVGLIMSSGGFFFVALFKPSGGNE